MIYKASLGKTATVVTAISTILFAAIIICLYLFIDSNSSKPIFPTILLLLIYAITYAFKPTGYKVTQDEVIVKRPIGDVHIRRDSIASVEKGAKDALKGSIRCFGDGGLWGFYGVFRNRYYGRMTWYVTRKDRIAVIKTIENKVIILSPDEVDELIAELGGKKRSTPSRF
jgi:hypothetical protein